MSEGDAFKFGLLAGKVQALAGVKEMIGAIVRDDAEADEAL